MLMPARVRRATVLAAAVLIVVTLFVGVRGSTQAATCVEARRAVNGVSWRDGTLREAGCRAWQHLRNEISERH